ncbi:MAG TPA: hypothetical protein PK165_05025 [bacterium]|nr:hypothetical protein [Victivallales bacterium]HPO52173.1 hypothetical protein [bacterium]
MFTKFAGRRGCFCSVSESSIWVFKKDMPPVFIEDASMMLIGQILMEKLPSLLR